MNNRELLKATEQAVDALCATLAPAQRILVAAKLERCARNQRELAMTQRELAMTQPTPPSIMVLPGVHFRGMRVRLNNLPQRYNDVSIAYYTDGDEHFCTRCAVTGRTPTHGKLVQLTYTIFCDDCGKVINAGETE